jgi:catechol 2,3-dioxygenase-like lactoylglutathione lyase family enzyme
MSDNAETSKPPHVTGIGGAFLFSDKARALADWYERHLGIAPLLHNPDEDCHYFEFTTPAPQRPGGVIRTTWAIFQAKEPLPTGRAFTINYRVSDLEAMLTHLRSLGVRVEKAQDESYGRFAWIRDPDGNRIELYQETG